jgi:hypothetical protein
MKRQYVIRHLPLGRNFLAINLFGFILTLRELNPTELNHELIHSVQQRELLYIPFFLWYALEWGCLYLKYRDGMEAYRRIRFEREAYTHQHDLQYLQHRRHWRYLQ